MVIVPIMTPAPGASELQNVVMSDNSDVEAATAKLASTAIEPAQATEVPMKPIRGTQVRLSVPLDTSPSKATSSSRGQTTTVHGTRKLLRRDSLDRREALLKGKEGTRQRRRWENDRLLSNPHAEPPLPSDWSILPTHPRRTIPYYLAPLWDAAEFQRAIESKLKPRRRRGNSTRTRKTDSLGNKTVYDAGMSPMEEAAANIPKEVRARLKHARSAKGLLQDLEEDVRQFVRGWNERELSLRRDGLADAPLHNPTKHTDTDTTAIATDGEDSDEEIVFVGRNGAMHDLPSSPSSKSQSDRKPEGLIATSKLVFQAPSDDKGAGFARWLVHCVGNYYGLRTWSVTADVDGEARRQAFVGVDERVRGFRGRCVDVGGEGLEVELPRPLWGMV